MNGTERTLNHINAAIEETEELEALLNSPATGYAIIHAHTIRGDISAAANTFGYFLEDFHGITPSKGLPDAAARIILDLNVADANATRTLHRLRLHGTTPKAYTGTLNLIIDVLTTAKQRIEALTPEDLTPKEHA